MKKVMLLGGNYFQMTATKAAKELGLHVISVDYLPDNPAHKFADEYHNVSTTDREAVLALAKELKIDGIVSYGSDVSAPTAAYVAERMGLPTNPLSAVEILTQKDRMRHFMEEHGFRIPKGAGFYSYDEGLAYFRSIKKPAMVKPVDASGSKGVTKIFDEKDFPGSWEEAMRFSRCKKVIIEEFLVRDGYQVAGDAFIVDGKLVFAGFMNEHFDRLCNPLVPIGESYPAKLSEPLRERSREEIQKLLTLLGMRMGAINMDFIIDTNGDVNILEIGPRNGGNLITDIIYQAEGIDLAKFTVLAAIGEKFEVPEPKREKMVSSYILHSIEDGKYVGTDISDRIKKDILRLDVWERPGDQIRRFDNASYGIGASLIRHDNMEEMCYRMDHMEEYIKVNVEK